MTFHDSACEMELLNLSKCKRGCRLRVVCVCFLCVCVCVFFTLLFSSPLSVDLESLALPRWLQRKVNCAIHSAAKESFTNQLVDK